MYIGGSIMNRDYVDEATKSDICVFYSKFMTDWRNYTRMCDNFITNIPDDKEFDDVYEALAEMLQTMREKMCEARNLGLQGEESATLRLLSDIGLYVEKFNYLAAGVRQCVK
jgi:RecJ-like exonuclease